MSEPKSAAEWLEAAGHQRDAEDDWRELQTALDMLRDAKAEMRKAEDAIRNARCDVTRPENVAVMERFKGWDAIERKWREGGYK